MTTTPAKKDWTGDLPIWSPEHALFQGKQPRATRREYSVGVNGVATSVQIPFGYTSDTEDFYLDAVIARFASLDAFESAGRDASLYALEAVAQLYEITGGTTDSWFAYLDHIGIKRPAKQAQTIFTGFLSYIAGRANLKDENGRYSKMSACLQEWADFNNAAHSEHVSATPKEDGQPSAFFRWLKGSGGYRGVADARRARLNPPAATPAPETIDAAPKIREKVREMQSAETAVVAAEPQTVESVAAPANPPQADWSKPDTVIKTTKAKPEQTQAERRMERWGNEIDECIVDPDDEDNDITSHLSLRIGSTAGRKPLPKSTATLSTKIEHLDPYFLSVLRTIITRGDPQDLALVLYAVAVDDSNPKEYTEGYNLNCRPELESLLETLADQLGYNIEPAKEKAQSGKTVARRQAA
jgi:hypothetical protein